MAKNEINSRISDLVTLKSMISNLKLQSNIIAFDPDSFLIYMTPNDGTGECFGIIYDPELIKASKSFYHYLINTPDVVAFNKALKKTKTQVELNNDKSLSYKTDGYQDTLNISYLDDYTDITKMYSKLFKDKEITKNCIKATYEENTNRMIINDHDFNRIKNNELASIVLLVILSLFLNLSLVV